MGFVEFSRGWTWLGGRSTNRRRDLAHLPKNLPHALFNPLKTPLRILAIAIPGGMEDFFDELSAAIEDPDFDDTTRSRISEKYGITWLE